MPLLEVMNFNADASCLSSDKWIKCLEGGTGSVFYQMLQNYVQSDRKVNLGLVGTAIKDISYYNHESIDLINNRPDIFELLLRPFTHDSPLLRIPDGFQYNLTTGINCIKNYFRRMSSYYLAPEIMATGDQIYLLAQMGIKGIFIHKGRYKSYTKDLIPDRPYYVKGVRQSEIVCISFSNEKLEKLYLDGLHGVEPAEKWADSVKSNMDQNLFIWRDGESCLLTPLGLKYEGKMLEAEALKGVERAFLSEINIIPISSRDSLVGHYFFPMRSMSPWLNEMKLYWLISRIRDLERKFDSLIEDQRLLWLLTINSDILSSVEKLPPTVDVSKDVLNHDPTDFSWWGVAPLIESQQVAILRSERAAEGEDYLAYLEAMIKNEISMDEIMRIWGKSGEAHLLKGYARLQTDVGC